MMIKTVFWSGVFHSFFISQVEKSWDKSWPLRFVCFWATTVYAGAIYTHLFQLPKGSMEYLLSHIFEPVAIILLFGIIAVSMLGAGAMIVSGKVRSTL